MSIIAEGTKGTFTGYKGDDPGEFKEGQAIIIGEFDQEDQTYTVTTDDGDRESLFPDEFIVESVAKAKTKKKATKKAATKKAPAKKAPAKKTSAKKKAATKTAKAVKPIEATMQEVSDVDPKEEAPKGASKERIPDPVPGKFVKTNSVRAALRESGDDPLLAARALVEQKEWTVFTLGGVLAFIKRNEIHTTITDDEGAQVYEEGLKGFNAYVEESLSLRSRSAHDYVRVYEGLSAITTESAISKIGISKLRTLAPILSELDSDTVKPWLEKAKKGTVSELREEVKREVVKGGGKLHGNMRVEENAEQAHSKVTRKFVLFEDQDDVIEEAFATLRSEAGEDQFPTDSSALVHIVQDWLMSRTGTPTTTGADHADHADQADQADHADHPEGESEEAQVG